MLRQTVLEFPGKEYTVRTEQGWRSLSTRKPGSHFPTDSQDAATPAIPVKPSLTLKTKRKNPIAWALGHISNMLITGFLATVLSSFETVTGLTSDDGVHDHSMTPPANWQTVLLWNVVFIEDVGLGWGGVGWGPDAGCGQPSSSKTTGLYYSTACTWEFNIWFMSPTSFTGKTAFQILSISWINNRLGFTTIKCPPLSPPSLRSIHGPGERGRRIVPLPHTHPHKGLFPFLSLAVLCR